MRVDIPLLSVVVPTYNRSDMLADALESLLDLETGEAFSYEILIVDNASTDDTRRVVQQAAAHSAIPLRYFHSDIPGDAPTRNRAVAESRGSWLAFFDDDQLAAPDWLRQLFLAAQETEADVVGGAVELHLSREVLAGIGPYVRRTSFRETQYSPFIQRYPGKQLPGCGNVLVRRELFDAVGTFNATMAWGGSDGDFFSRAQAAAYSIYYTPHAVIRHRIPTNRLAPEYFRWDAQQGGDSQARHDYQRAGIARIAVLNLARIAQAALILLPKLAWARLKNDTGGMLDNRVRLWRSVGYFRRSLALVAPKWFSQDQYFDNLKFRKGRSIGKAVAELDAAAMEMAS